MQKVIAVFLMLQCAVASAGEIRISSTTAAPNAQVAIDVSHNGDGSTRSLELNVVFDDSKLDLPVASGVIPNAGQNGTICIRQTRNRVLVVSLENISATAQSLLCRLPFQILPSARPGTALIEGINAICYVGNAQLNPNCRVQNGSIRVTGISTPAPVAAISKFKYLYFLLSAQPGAPTVAQLAGFDFSSNLPRPMSALSIESPQLAGGMLAIRAQGEFASYLRANSELPRAKLERYVIVQYGQNANLQRVKTALLADPFVLAVYEGQPDLVPTSRGITPSQLGPVAFGKNTQNQYHLTSLNLPNAWAIAGGWSLLGFADSGLHTNSPYLRSFSGAGSVGGTRVAGGNFLPIYSFDEGDFPTSVDSNVDEAQPIPAVAGSPADALLCDQADGVTDQLMVPTFAGHGTNASGIAVANGAAGIIEGVCKNCGVGMWKIARASCSVDLEDVRIRPSINLDAIPRAITVLADTGAQVINLSFGGNLQTPAVGFCAANPNEANCLALSYAEARDVVISAASGNQRARIQFPARDGRPIAVGGTNLTGGFWDEAPGTPPPDYANCPFGEGGSIFGNGSECGSNFTTVTGERRQEIVAPARNIRATAYPGKNWNDTISCGDSYGGGANNDGVGICTGTSMSAPIVTGLYGLLRSINPLLRAGNPETVELGVRDVVTATTNRAQQSLPWNNQFGYGTPDAGASAAKVIGTVRGQLATNRVTPLFAFYSPGATDYAVTATPQTAMALIFNGPAGYRTEPDLFANFIFGDSYVPNYPEFPSSYVGQFLRAPRASAYILTTENAPRTVQNHEVAPLYLLDRGRIWPTGCNPVAAGCNINNRDFILLSSVDQMNNAVAAGYSYRGYQGFLYKTQAPGTQALYLKCNTNEDDCAVFIESQRSQFEANGYTSNFATASTSILGYAYPSTDSDSDGLVDGMELVIGTDPNDSNSDDDGLTDVQEFPMVGISNSDPCDAIPSTCTAPSATPLFADGFE